MTRVQVICCYLLTSILFLLPAHAQPDKATLRGIVVDSSGKSLAGIGIDIIESETNVTARRVVTGSQGSYDAPYLKPGLYKLTIEHQGFESFVAEDVLLDPGRVRRLDPALVRGPVDNTTSIHDEAPLIQTAGGRLGDLIDNRKWLDAPVVRVAPSPLPLLIASPGVQGNGDGLVISGFSRNQQTFTLDGVAQDTLATPQGHPNYFETIVTTTANPGVELSRPTGFEMTSKRGTETFHGTAYYKWGSSALNAPSYFQTGKTPYTLSEAGGEAGGRIWKERTFLFVGWTHQQNPYNQTIYANVPTELMRNRDFSQYLNTQTSPTGAVVAIRDPRNGAPFPNNVIPSNRLSSVASNFLANYYPAANTGDANAFSQNYSWSHPYSNGPYKADWPFFRIDQKLWAENHAYVRWMEVRSATISAGSIGEQLNSTQARAYRSLAISDTQSFSANFVNSLTVGQMSDHVRQGQEQNDFTPITGDSVINTVGLQGVNMLGNQTMGFPTVTIAGLTGLGMSYGGGTGKNVTQRDGSTTFDDTVAWSGGRHSLKFGAQYMHNNWFQGAVPQTVYGSFDFTGAMTGVGFADFLLGLPSTSTRQNPRTNRKLHQNQGGLFLAGTFRVSSRLTLDYGMRWDYYGSPVYDDGYMYNWNPANGHVIVAPGTLTAVSSLYPASIAVDVGRVVPRPKLTNYRPRVAAAYRIGNRTVLRGGYGEFTESRGYGASGLLNDAGPFGLLETYQNSITNGNAALSFPKPFPTTASASLLPSQSVTALPAQTDEGVIRQYNATVEHGVHGLGIRASYIGSRGTGMNYTLDINKPVAGAAAFNNARRPYSQFASTNVTRADGEWHYDALQAQIKKRAGAVTFDSSFTWANNIGNYANTYDPYHVTDQWTRDAANRRLYFAASAVWSAPIGQGRRFFSQAGPLMNRVIGNWSLQTIAVFASGQYYSPLFTGPDPANASPGYVTQLPDCTGDPNSGARTVSRRFNPLAFSIPAASAGRYGTCGMNILEGYPIHVAHLSLAKPVAIGERVKAVLTARISNITNTPHFTIPNNNISNPNPGQFAAASVIGIASPEQQGSRQIDLRIRIQW